VVGVLPGTDTALKNELIVISAHLDHLGVGEPINGDAIYNGAMDNASGIATLIETAAAASARGGFKRSLVFAAVTAEEKGLLGSRYFANRLSLPGSVAVANLNTDGSAAVSMGVVTSRAFEESDLANDLKKVARPLAIEAVRS
jgi:Zn-dependent M28 family amino/carboxypeptidase